MDGNTTRVPSSRSVSFDPRSDVVSSVVEDTEKYVPDTSWPGYAWRTLVGGHLGRLGRRADVDLQRQSVSDLAASARATVARLDPTPSADVARIERVA
jgi:hypothetical protein